MIDVVVIGGGLAGLTSATRAAGLGLSVVVLEQGVEEEYPCNSRYAGGIVHLSYNDPEVDIAELLPILKAKCPADIDFSLVEAVARNSRRSLDWLREVGGAKFVKGGSKAYERLVLAPPRPAQPRLKWPGRGPDLLLRNLGAKAAGLGVDLRRGHRATGLERQQPSGFVVRAETGNGTVTLEARTVIIADGGFQSDPELMQAHVTPDFAGLLQRNAGTGRGSGIRLAQSVGARLTDLTAFYGHLASRLAMTNEDLWPYPYLDPLATAGIVVGRNGRRFTNEARGGVFIANAIARQEEPAETCVVFDAAIWDTAGRESKIPPNPNLERYGARIITADTIAGLAAAAGIDPAGLAATIEALNTAVDTAGTETLDPPRSAGPIAPSAIRKPPFYAVPACAGITHTMGGIMIDDRTRLQSEGGGHIPGLYAAGSAAGGLEGGQTIFYLGGLAKAVALGLLAGENAAEYVAAAKV